MDRESVLEDVIVDHARHGWRVQSRSATQATLVWGKPISHLLHLFLTLLTLGVWAVVWVLLAIFGGQRHKVVTIDPDGRPRYA